MTNRIGHMLPATAFAAALGLAFASPAFAQSTPGAGGASSGGSQASGPKASGSQAGAGQQAQAQAQTMSQDKLRQQLTKAGFRDVKILDAAYLVQARTEDGNDVMMMINPPASGIQTSGAMGASSATGSSGTPSPNASGGGSSSQQGSGSTR